MSGVHATMRRASATAPTSVGGTNLAAPAIPASAPASTVVARRHAVIDNATARARDAARPASTRWLPMGGAIPRMPHRTQTLALAAALLAPAAASAHQNSLTPLTLTVEGRIVTATARIDALDLNEALALPSSALPSRADALARAAQGGRYLGARLRLTHAGIPCTPGDASAAVVDRADAWALAVTVPYTCAHRVEAPSVDYALFFDVDPQHRGLATLDGLGAPRQFVFQSDRRRWSVDASPPLRAQLGQYLRLGVEHIFTGYDHVAFVVTLLVLAAALRARDALRHVLSVVTSFTVAHSLTLVSAALGWVVAPARVVEPVIALSILYVAASNLRRDAPPPRSRAVTTFAFGLVHGLGFADVLRELGLPARATVPSLLAFNVGVELGQLAVVVALLPLLHAMSARRSFGAQLAWSAALGALAVALLPALGPPRATVAVLAAVVVVAVVAARHWTYDRVIRQGLSLALCLLALLWTVERLSGHTVFQGVLG